MNRHTPTREPGAAARRDYLVARTFQANGAGIWTSPARGFPTGALLEEAAEGRRAPGCFVLFQGGQIRASVLDCGGPPPLWKSARHSHATRGAKPTSFGRAARSQDAPELFLRGRNLSLSPGERAGVRGNGSTRHHNTPGFTLIELLVVITIIGILAGIALPQMSKFKPNVSASAEQQLMASLNHARQLAISQRTTVCMVFVPTNFFSGNPALNPNAAAYVDLTNDSRMQAEFNKSIRLLDKQLVGYAFVALRTMGDQPGQANPHYLSPWRTLPEGAYIPFQKFLQNTNNTSVAARNRYYYQPVLMINADTTDSDFVNTNVLRFLSYAVPFPSDQVTNKIDYFYLPGIAFDYMGRLVDQGGNLLLADELIPLAKGAVGFARDSSKRPTYAPPSITDVPPGNATNISYDVVQVDWLTGRSRAHHFEIK